MMYNGECVEKDAQKKKIVLRSTLPTGMLVQKIKIKGENIEKVRIGIKTDQDTEWVGSILKIFDYISGLPVMIACRDMIFIIMLRYSRTLNPNVYLH